MFKNRSLFILTSGLTLSLPIFCMQKQSYSAIVIANIQNKNASNSNSSNAIATTSYNQIEKVPFFSNPPKNFPSNVMELKTIVNYYENEKKISNEDNYSSLELNGIKNSYDQSLLTVSAMAGSYTGVSKLLALGVPVDAADIDGETALSWATSSGIQIPQALSAFNNYFSALQDKLNAYATCVKILLEHGAKITVRQKSNGMTPLHSACIAGNVTAVEHLLFHAKKRTISEKPLLPLVVNARETVHQRTPLHCVIRFIEGAKKKILSQNDRETGEKLLKLLLDNGANASLKDDYNNTPYDCIKNLLVTRWPAAEELLKPPHTR